MSRLRKLYYHSRFVLLGLALAIAFFIYTPETPNAQKTVSAQETSVDLELAKKLGQEIIAACPVVTELTHKAV